MAAKILAISLVGIGFLATEIIIYLKNTRKAANLPNPEEIFAFGEVSEPDCEADFIKSEAAKRFGAADIHDCEADIHDCEAYLGDCEAYIGDCEAYLGDCEAYLHDCEAYLHDCDWKKKLDK